MEVAIWSDRIEVRAISREGEFDHAVLGREPATDAGLATGTDLKVDQSSAAMRLASIGVIAWLIILAIGWFRPGIGVGRLSIVLLAASSLSMVSVFTGLTLLALSAAT